MTTPADIERARHYLAEHDRLCAEADDAAAAGRHELAQELRTHADHELTLADLAVDGLAHGGYEDNARGPRPQSRGFLVIDTRTGEILSPLLRTRAEARTQLMQTVASEGRSAPHAGDIEYQGGHWYHRSLGVHQVMLYPGETFSPETYRPNDGSPPARPPPPPRRGRHDTPRRLERIVEEERPFEPTVRYPRETKPHHFAVNDADARLAGLEKADVIRRVVREALARKAWRSATEKDAINWLRGPERVTRRADVVAYVREQFDSAGAGYSGRWQ